MCVCFHNFLRVYVCVFVGADHKLSPVFGSHQISSSSIRHQFQLFRQLVARVVQFDQPRPLMSHDQVELQRFISTASAGSVSTAMSGSGSFAGESVHHHTDADASTNPVYSSIPESQMAHQQFVARQVRRGSGLRSCVCVFVCGVSDVF